MTETTAEPRMRRIYFAPDESGWAWFLGGDRYLVKNIPLTDTVNFHDLVRCEPNDRDVQQVVEVVDSEYPRKTGVFYQTVGGMHRLSAILRICGCHVEPMIGPRGAEPGVIMVAHSEDVDPQLLAEAIGVAAEPPDAD